jgi:hypothetical protein
VNYCQSFAPAGHSFYGEGELTMCDYSLMAVPNRLAREGEELVTHRFPTGSLGLASSQDLKRARPVRVRKSFWSTLRDFFDPPAEGAVCAVCIPPGARLTVELRGGVVEEATFTQLSAAENTYRDALRFPDGRQLRLQELREGVRVAVLDLSAAAERETVVEYPVTVRL